jgi:hypothetical protein
MGIRRSFKDVPDSTGFTLVSAGRHPARMHVDAYQHDAAGNFALDGAGQKVYWETSTSHDPLWKLHMEILDGDHRGATVDDNLNFSSGGMKRVKVVYKRGGFATGDEEDIELEPEDLDGSCWWITVEHEVSIDFKTKEERPRKRGEFSANGCTCATCVKYDGKDVYVQHKITFDGFEPMAAKEAAEFAKRPSPAKLRAAEQAADVKEYCMPCNMGEHAHTLNKGCPCLHDDHPDF